MSKFEARKYSLGSGQAQPVSLTVAEGCIHIEENGQSTSIPLDEIELEIGGHDDDRIKLYDRASAITLLCTNHGLLDALEHADTTGNIKTQTAKCKKKVSALPFLKQTYWLRVGMVLLMLGSLSYFAIDRVVDIAADKIDPNIEKELGKRIAKDDKLDTTSAGAKRVEAIGKKLLQHLGKTPYEFHFYLSPDKDVNAFAMPGGYVVVNQGLLDKASSDDEIAGVMGHEIGHVVHRDTIRQALHGAGVLVCLGVVTGLGGDYAEKVGEALSLGRYLETQNFSRGQEAKADMTGVDLAYSAGYKPEAMITFFERLQKEDALGDNKLLALISDHPMNSDRIKSIRAEIDRLKQQRHPQ
jgi:beta-barrel assembly-enhancing protease